MSDYNIYPAVDDEYNFPPVVRQAIADSDEVKGSIAPEAWAPSRNVPADADLNTYRVPGVSRITTPDTKTILNLPPGMTQAGNLENLTAGTPSAPWGSQLIMGHGNLARMWWRSSRDTAGNWNDWNELTGWATFRSVPADADLNNYRTPGLSRIRTPDTATIVNLPTGMRSSGILQNLVTGDGTDSIITQEIYENGTGGRSWWRSPNDAGQLGQWSRQDENNEPVTEWHVFLAAGQSNMSGRGIVNTVSGSRYITPRIAQFGFTRRVLETATVPLDMHDTALGLSPATTFANTYLRSQPAYVGVVIVPAAHGGTGFTTSTTTHTWTPNVATNPLYDLPASAVKQTKDALAAVKGTGASYAFKGILWHQGENNGSMTTEQYATNLDALIAYFRAELAVANLAFVVGQMCPEGIAANLPGRSNVDLAHRQTPSRVPYTAFAPASVNGYNPGDTTHMSKQGINFLGGSYAAAMHEVHFNIAQLNAVVPSAIADALAADPSVVEAAADLAASNTGLLTKWKPNTAYTAGQQVFTPAGDIVTRTVDGTSGATYTSTNWTASATAQGLASKMDNTARGAANGVAPLDASGLLSLEDLPDLSGLYAELDAGDKILYAQLPDGAKAKDDKKPIGEGAFGLWAHDYGCKGDYRSTSNKGTDNADALDAFRDAAKAAAVFGAVCLNFGPGAFRTTREWDIYRSNSPRLDFVIKGESNLTTFILADFYGTGKRLIKSHDPLGVTRSSPTTIAHIQLGTVDRSGPNPVLLDIYGHGESRIESVRFGPCNNTVMTIAALQNVRYRDIVSFYGGKHYSYRDTTGITFSSTSGSTTVTASADIFNGSDAGRLLNLFGTTATKYLISTYVDARNVIISGTTPAITQTAVPGQFEPARITTVAGSNQVSANASVFTSDDIGRIIYILGARSGPWGAALLRGTITELVSGLTVKLDVTADIAVTRTEFSVPVIEFYSPSKVGQLGTINGGCNDFKVDLLHIENYKGMGFIAQDTVFGRITDMKIHGEVTPTNTQASSGAMWLDDYAGHISGDLDGHALGDHRIHYCNMNDTLTFGDLNTRRGVNARIHQVGVMTDPGGYVVIKTFNSYSATTSGDPYDMVEDTNTTPRLIHDGFVNMLGDSLEPRIYTGRWSYVTMAGERVMYSPNKTRYKLVVSDAGVLTTTAATG